MRNWDLKRRCRIAQASLRGALATKQSSFLIEMKQAGLLRFARNDGTENSLG
jgi:hypothetical protein